MKKIIKTIEIEIEKLRNHIQTREDKIDDMSERWQESQKCGDWIDKIIDIEEQLNELEQVIDNLKNLNP